MKQHNEKGSALIFAVILVLVLSVMAASLMFLSQSETWSSMNYRMMNQARYGAEAGLNAAANFLMNNYTMPGVGGADPIAAYTTNVSPVTIGGNPVVLSSLAGMPSNYPVAAVQTAFSPASSGSLKGGNNTVNYTASAQLLYMRQVRECGNGQWLTAQVWKITSHGDLNNGVRNAEVEVSALLEAHVTPCYNYAAYATNSGCNSIQFNGGGTIDSYDSSNMTLQGGNPVTQLYDGNLGSNGNLNTAPGTVVNGTFSSPDKGVGACGLGGTVDAISGNAAAVTGCETALQLGPPSTCPSGANALVPMSQPLTLQPPVTDYPGCTGPGTAGCDNATANALGNQGSGTILPGNYGDVSLAGNKTITLSPGTDPITGACTTGIYYINSISLAGNAQLTIAPCPGPGPASYQPVIINIVGANGATPLDLGGNGIANPTFNSMLIQFQYGGTGGINLHGNGDTTAVIYAPGAPVTLSGNGTVYGSVIGSKVLGNGVPVKIHYDRALARNLATVGNWTLDTFTWSKY